MFQGLLEGEEVGALCSSHVCEPPSPLNPEPHETSDSEHITQYKIVIMLMLALMLIWLLILELMLTLMLATSQAL